MEFIITVDVDHSIKFPDIDSAIEEAKKLSDTYNHPILWVASIVAVVERKPVTRVDQTVTLLE